MTTGQIKTLHEIINESPATGPIIDMLNKLPGDQQQEMLHMLDRVIKIHYDIAVTNGLPMIKSVQGYVGDEYLDRERRILWQCDFPEPLPSPKSEEDYRDSHIHFGFKLFGETYLFRKANGKFLGKTYIAENS